MPRRFFCAAIIALLGTATFAADLSLPSFELFSQGTTDESGTFRIQSRMFGDFLYVGGAKFTIQLKFAVMTANLEQAFAEQDTQLPPTATSPDIVARLNSSTDLRLRAAAATMYGVFGLPVDVTYFVGRSDRVGTGDEFATLFGGAPLATVFRGYSHFPAGIGGDPYLWYDGLHEVAGTGVRLGAQPVVPWFAPYLYAYQDTRLGEGKYSFDARLLFNFEKVKLEVFAGASCPESKYGIYRGGLLFFFDTGTIGEFYAQMGIPLFDPADSAALATDKFFFLFEPRLRFGLFAAIMTLFKHPAYYTMVPTNEGEVMDYSVDMRLGDLTKNTMQGGVRTVLQFNSAATSEPLTVAIVPYYSFVMNGVIWDFKLSINAYPYSPPWQTVFAPSVGMRTSF